MLQPAPLFSGLNIPEHLPGEPERKRSTPLALAFRLLLRLIGMTLLVAITAGLWPLFLAAALIWGWPPNVPRLTQIRRYLRLVWTVTPPAPGLSTGARAWLTLSILQKCVLVPVTGLAWLLDEILYGKALDATPVVAPLIEISAARSGSTQLARYLEDDPHLAAPSLLQAFFPYLWLWKLAPKTIGRFITPDQVRHKLETMLPLEFLQRHEGDPFRTDTFDGVLFTSHLNGLSGLLGPDVMVEEFSFGTLAPHNRALWEEIFVEMLDRIARKTLLHAGPAPDGTPRRFFVKGHFLCAANALERRYPDGRFLTMIREPAPRLQSGVNFLRANPMEMPLGFIPWAWIAQAVAHSESEYCELEQRWFSRQEGARRCVIRFSEYVKDLEGAMAKVYRECLDTETLPPHVPRVHPPRERTNYLLNRSLAQVGVDEAALNERLKDYIAWCRGMPSP